MHSGISQAEIVISTVPDYLLKGTSNARLVRKGRRTPTRRLLQSRTCSRTFSSSTRGADYVLSSVWSRRKELWRLSMRLKKFTGRPARCLTLASTNARKSCRVKPERLHALHTGYRLIAPAICGETLKRPGNFTPLQYRCPTSAPY